MSTRTIVAGAGIAAVLAIAGAGWLYGEDLRSRLFDDPALRSCDLAARAAMKAPSTYRRVDGFIEAAGHAAWVQFDSQNGFGAMVRGTARCGFAFRPGALPSMAGDFAISSMAVDGDYLDQLSLIHATFGLAPIEAGRTSLQPD